MKLRRFTSFILSIAITLTVSISVHAASTVSFSDVPDTYWAKNAIMDMVERGMFNGTSAPVNGVSQFSPNSPMTRAQLVVVLTRYLYPDELSAMVTDTNKTWYEKNYSIALKHGLLGESEFDCGDLTKYSTRQEMAMLLVRAAKLSTGETPDILVPISRIADYSAVDNYYRDYVRQAYSMGLLAGVDNSGTFKPETALNRSQAATVIYRLIDPSTRSAVKYDEIGTFTWPSGVTYVGDYKDGESNGYGKMTFPKVGVYEGYFVDGKRSGIGTFTWNVGDSYVGNWENDAMSGNGTYIFSDGYVISGTWEKNSIPIEQFSMNTSTLTLEEGTSTQIIAICKPKNTTEAITWKSSNESIIAISSKRNLCTINAVAVGNATITATTASGKTSICDVTVKEASKTTRQITLNHGDYSLNIGESVALTATVVPANAIDGSIQWSSASGSVANVSANGVVTAYAEGTAVISATSENGVVATCYITVYNPKVQLWNGNWNVYSSDSSGNKKTTSATATSIIDIANSTAYLSFYPFSSNAIPISESGNYTLLGTFDTSLSHCELAFTSINENQIILEIKNIDLTYSAEYVTAAYYLLVRQ